MVIPEKIERKLSDHMWKRPSQAGLEDAFVELRVQADDPFCEFFRKFRGPFSSTNVAYELLDVTAQDESIVTNTRVVRQQFGFQERYLVVSSMIGHSVLVYDSETGGVYDVDFEGGDKLLADGKLASRWQSWWKFADEYFS